MHHSQQAINQSCACSCGKSTFNVHGSPISRFFCHCQICQSVYKKAFADVTVFWDKNISLPENHTVEFNRHRLPPALRRGICPSCKAPVVGFLRLAPFVQLVFVPSQNFPIPSKLPAPQSHIFYHRRVADVDDGLPKISAYWPSELAVTKMVLGSLFGSGHTK